MVRVGVRAPEHSFDLDDFYAALIVLLLYPTRLSDPVSPRDPAPKWRFHRCGAIVLIGAVPV
jgi:hypothetical protein